MNSEQKPCKYINISGENEKGVFVWGEDPEYVCVVVCLEKSEEKIFVLHYGKQDMEVNAKSIY